MATANRQLNKGFGLIEALIAVMLVGLAIASLVAANISFTKANSAGTKLSTAEFLAQQIKELTAMLAVVDPQSTVSVFGPEEAGLSDYDDLDDFDGADFSPPIGADRVALNDFAAFRQQITVQNVGPADFGQVVSDHGSAFVRVTVNVLLNSEQITSASWIRSRY